MEVEIAVTIPILQEPTPRAPPPRTLKGIRFQPVLNVDRTARRPFVKITPLRSVTTSIKIVKTQVERLIAERQATQGRIAPRLQPRHLLFRSAISRGVRTRMEALRNDARSTIAQRWGWWCPMRG